MKYFLSLLGLEVVVTWPVWRWYILRLTDHSDEPWGALAILVLAGMTGYHLFRRRRQKTSAINACLPGLLLAVYAACYAFVPPLIRAAIAMTALTATISQLIYQRSFHLGVWGLGCLSLPLFASLNFYLGYPLRVLVAVLAVPVLRCFGGNILREGAGLRWGNQLILVDAPCSGIKMLWVGAFLVCLLSCWWNLRFRSTFLAAVLALMVLIAGNVERCVGLFYVESGLLSVPSGAHLWVGLLVFALTVLGIWYLTQYLATQKEQAA